jgi:hypothetical protein
MSVLEKINERAALVKWANDTERFLKNSIQGKRLVDSGRLKNSIKKDIIGLTSDVKTFVFSFSLHGMYVDMGLFGGKSLDDNAETKFIKQLTGKRGPRNKLLKNRNKKQYQWYSRTMYGSINALNSILLEKYGDKAIQQIDLPEIIEL